MKLFHLLAIATVIAFCANVSAQPAASAKGIKITKITGTVNILKDGVVLMTLKPGDAIPELTDNKVTFAIVDGTVEVEAGGKKISGATGSNFTITSDKGQVNVALGAGTPVAVKSESGHNVILTANSEVEMVNAGGKVEITLKQGNAIVTNASGGETQSLQPGQTASIPVTPVIAQAATTAATDTTDTGTTDTDTTIVETQDSSVIDTRVVEENKTVSGSTPG